MSNLRQECITSHLQNTSLTTLGMLREGFRVSPAVIPRLSVPPSIQKLDFVLKFSREPTCKASRYKYICKPREATDERGARDRPVMTTNVGVGCVDADIHEYAGNNECDYRYHFKERKPIF